MQMDDARCHHQLPNSRYIDIRYYLHTIFTLELKNIFKNLNQKTNNDFFSHKLTVDSRESINLIFHPRHPPN